MSMRNRLAALWRDAFHRARVDRDFDDELRAYTDLAANDNVRRGMDDVAARRAAMIEVGGAEQVKEQVRRVSAGLSSAG